MKKLTLIAIALIMALPTFAQQKLGHIDSAALLELMPEKAKAEKELEVFAKEFQTALEAMGKEYESKVSTFQSTEKDMIKTVRDTKLREISDLEKRIQDFQKNAQDEISKKEQDLLTPIIDKARKAIDEVAEAKGYTYIFDSSGGFLLYSKDTEDVMPEVKAKLGL